MARTSVLSQHIPEIESFFDSLPNKSFSELELKDIFTHQKEQWKIPDSNTSRHFIAFLEEKTDLKRVEFERDGQSRTKTLFVWKAQDDLSIIAGLKKGGYYTHYTAMSLHNLTLQIPKVYYLNTEHSQNPISTPLSQEDIDQAFSKEQRKTNLTYSYKNKKVFLLNSKNTGELGVKAFNSETEYYRYTDLERTLIDIAIRPAYSGGVFEVLEAYRQAKGKVNITKLHQYLQQLDYSYPYHQVIGFYLEKAGYSESEAAPFERDTQLNFYLTYNLRAKQFSDRWKLFYPRGM